MSAREFLRQAGAGQPDLPIVVYSETGLPADLAEVHGLTESRVVKDVRSPEGLLDETTLFLHCATERLPAPQRRVIEQLHDLAGTFAGRKVLIVDDDPRNVFALTSLLESNGMEVVSAETGMEALALLRATPGVDIALMDIMMPDMDGYEAIRAIRGSAEFRDLPIVALTAKAMKGDREKCVEAGATDYIAKPADPTQLLAALRVWLSR
jgi:CheY-like chemotaxis protein